MLFRNFSQIECRAGWRMFCRVQLTAVWALLLQSANGLTASPRLLASSSSPSIAHYWRWCWWLWWHQWQWWWWWWRSWWPMWEPPCRVTEHHVLAQQPAPRLQKGKVDFFWSSFLHIHSVADFVMPLREKQVSENANNHLLCCFFV